MTEKCPFTASLIESEVPSHGAVAFSVLQPNTYIKPHCGKAGDYLRCHLGLEIPNGDCGINVSGETLTWQTGKTIVFDDRVQHDAWNRTTNRRVVLLFDFIP
jgi:beta-hydroxylase